MTETDRLTYTHSETDGHREKWVLHIEYSSVLKEGSRREWPNSRRDGRGPGRHYGKENSWCQVFRRKELEMFGE